jgi:preprotein translocase SecE subunit
MAFKIYKRGQGYYTRLYSALTFFAIVVCGCLVLHGELKVSDEVLVVTLVPAGVCVGFGLLIYWLVNKATVADFLIAAEGEIKKVSWSSRHEIIVSTFIVICVVMLVGALLGSVDVGFRWFFDEVIGLY